MIAVGPSDYIYFRTPEAIANRIAEAVSKFGVTHVVDLGAGDGTLFRPFLRTLDPERVLAIEADEKHFGALRQAGVRFRGKDLVANGYRLPREFLEPDATLLSVSNPPYGQVRATPATLNLLRQAGFHVSRRNPMAIRMEQVFLARALVASSTSAVLAFLMPSAFCMQERWTGFRRALVQAHCIHEVMHLSPSTFAGTEVLASVIILTKSDEQKAPIKQSQVGLENAVFPSEISIDDFVSGEWRMDGAGSRQILKDLSPEIARGADSANNIRLLNLPCVHSTDLSRNHGKGIKVEIEPKRIVNGQVFAEPGDILVARVGTRCIGKVSIVHSGKAPISDCVIRIRVRKPLRQRVFAALKGEVGQRWLKANASGSCARILTYRSILNVPV